MHLPRQALICLVNIIAFVIGEIVLEDDFGDNDPKDERDPMFSARGSSVMKIPHSAKSDSRARGDVQAFKQNASELSHPHDYFDEDAGNTLTITLTSSAEVEYSTTLLTSTTVDDGESWELTTSLNIAATSDQWVILPLATTKRNKISMNKKKSKIHIRTTRRPSGLQPLQQIFALKSWMSKQHNQSGSIEKNLFQYLEQ